MRVLYCTAEALPFAGSGGLGDVAGSLPKALKQKGVDCRVVLPLYGDIPQSLRDSMHYITNFSVNASWRNMYCGLFWAEFNGVTFYFIDNEYYFGRHGLYGFYDDAERYAFFSRACLEMLTRVDFHPDIIHANDWQTALVPVYYYAMYSKNPWYSNIKSVFTIHNIQYQGKYGWSVSDDCVGLPQEYNYLLEFDGEPNFVKAAIQSSTRVTTVSPTYANELRHDWFGYGLSPTIRDFSYKMCGILNGIDSASFDPATDYHLYSNYSADNLYGKGECKYKLQERLGLERRWDIPMIAMVTRLVEQKGLDLVRSGLEYLMDNEDVQFVILGSGDAEYEEYFSRMQQKYPGRVCACHGYINELSRKIYSASDIFLMPSKSEPCGLSQMIALRYGSVPVVRKVGGLADSIIDSGANDGNGFTFNNYDSADMVNALRRAIAGYWNRDGWIQLMYRGMTWDNSWARSAQDYINVYEDTVNNWA